LKFTHKSLILTLKVCVFLIFIGRAYQYLFFDAPFRALLWDEGLLQPLVEGLFNTPWNDYVTSMKADAWINRIVGFNGILYVIAAFSAIFITSSNKKYLKYPIRIGAFLLVLLSLLSAKDKFYHYGQFFEHAIQFGVPFVLLMAVNIKSNVKKISLYLKVLIAITFTAHGLYALGYYPIPGYFIDMTISCINVTEDIAVLILNTAGVLDILLSILIFVPKLAKYALIYAFIWGLMTSLARAVAFFNADFVLSSFHQSMYLVVYRLSHGVIPLLVYFIDYKLKNNKPKF
jgi:hypothetical protein